MSASNMLTKKNFERLVEVTCALVALFQSVTIMLTFVQKPYLISSTSSYPQTFQLPALSICAHTKLYDPNYYTMFDNRVPQAVKGKEITFGEHYNSSQLSGLVQNCVVLLPNLTAAKCHHVSKIKIYVNKQVICYTYFDRDFMNEEFNYNMKIVAGFMMFEIMVNSHDTIDEIITLVIHGNLMRPVPYFSSAGSVDINVNETSAVFALVDMSIITNLNPPDDVCFDYNQLNYRNIDDCLTRCVFNMVVNRTGKWPGEMFGTLASPVANRNLLMNMDHDSSNESVSCFDHVCSRKDCTQLDFTTTIRNRIPTDRRGRDRETVTINIGK